MTCPSCGSSASHLHPAVQHEGEVQPCPDAFHLAATAQNTPERIASAQRILDLAIEGWYYLHANGDLIYKGAAYTSVSDFHESDLVRAFWPCHPDDRENAWTILVEALAGGARLEKVRELADRFGCTDDDAQEYARRIDVALAPTDDGRWAASPAPLVLGRDSVGGVGETALQALAALAGALGYRPSKLRAPATTFALLVRAHADRLRA